MATGSEIEGEPPPDRRPWPLRAVGDAAAGAAARGVHLAQRLGDAVVENLPLNEIMAQVDIQALLDRVDLEALLDRVDVQKIIDRVDVEAIIDRVDVEAIIDRVDVNAMIDRVDVNAMIGKVDMQSMIESVDLNAVMGNLDLDAVLQRTDLGQVIAQSTGGIASNAVDLMRRQGVGLDGFLFRWAQRLRPRLRDAPAGPRLLVNEPTP